MRAEQESVMSSIDIIKEIAPALARRRIVRGFRWLMEHESTFPVSMWLSNPRVYVPRARALHEEHMLVTAFSNTFSRRPWRSFERIVADFGLTEQFLIAHAFARDEIIDESILDFCWREGLFVFHLERDLSPTPSALTPEVRRMLHRTLTH